MRSIKAEIRKLAILSLAIVPLGVYAAAKITDDQIEQNAKNSHVFKTYLKEDSIDVDSKNGVVTLTGSVNEASHKALAEDTVTGLNGVKKVEDKLTVKGESQASSDKWIEAKVKSALLFHRNVSGLRTEVSSKEGVVTLQGTADSASSKELAAQYAQDVEGVKSVSNQLTVQNSNQPQQQTIGEKIDDASITAQVKAVLLYHKSTSALKTKVTTTEGVVSLHGTARDSAEKDLVSKLVEDINGVKSVKNNMTVRPATNG